MNPTFPDRLVRHLSGDALMPSWLVWSFAMLLSMAVAWMVTSFGWVIGIGLAAAAVVAPLVGVSAGRHEVGIWIVLVLAFSISVANRLAEGLPLGISLDVMILWMLAGIFFEAAVKRDLFVFSQPMTIPILAWAAMNVFEVLNPVAASREAWFYVVRPAVEYMMLFFITVRAIESREALKRWIWFFLLLCTVSALWGIRQATIGYFEWEYNYVLRHDLVHLVFNYGRWRAIGSIGSPSQFGIIMAVAFLISVTLAVRWQNRTSKVILYGIALLTLLATVYSGTRTAYIVIPVFLMTMTLLSRSKKVYALLGAFGLVVGILAVMPTNNYHIQRIQSVFKSNNDASYLTRVRNRNMIMPWIAAHPIGGGLGSTGVWGQRFSPGTFLANFPPDSGLVRVAVELGWVGLLIFLSVFAWAVIKGTIEYWRLRDREMQAVAGSILSLLPALLLAEWGQEVVGVFPMSLIFWMLLAIMFRAFQLAKN